ncbi:MAG: spore coat protein CotJB [Paenisporosarcina sp.]|nr:spore coat protein CotJB [Paenisporosarcina sp.]
MSEEQRNMLLSLQIADFNALDWILYMHTHPDDLAGCEKRKHMMKVAAKIRKSYEASYGPLTNLTPISCTEKVCQPWPWQI